MSLSSDNKGFTLIEVLIAFTVISIATISLMQTQVTLARSYALSTARYEASSIAEEVMNKALLGQFNLSQSLHTGTEQMAEDQWQWSLVIEPLPSSEGLLSVRVEVMPIDSSSSTYVLYSVLRA